MLSKNYLFFIFLLIHFVVFSQEKSKNSFGFKWDKGFKIESADKQFKLKFGGRMMIDYAFFSQDNNLDIAFNPLTTTSGTELRRARIFTSGTLYGNVDYKFSVDFAGNQTTIKDAYIGLKNISFFGNVRIGHVKEPFRLDVLTSSKYMTFMERSFIDDFMQTRNNGIVFFNDYFDHKVSIQAGYFLNEDNSSDDKAANKGYAITGRITSLLINNIEQKELLHIGFAYTNRKSTSKEYRIESRPEGHLSRLKYISTGPISSVKNINMLNFETAFVKNSFSFQSEYLTAKINTGILIPIDSYTFSTYYGEVSYFLTGESRRFKNSYEGFGRVNPKNNYGKNGSGAWEIALRYSNSDLNDGDIFGGEQTDIVLGLNWYLNPSTRFMLNNVFADVKNKGKVNIFQFRFQIDF
ncbi:Porin O [Polaribacter huanghezhanensis]|uniref:OprO/OprP family phosphate-selective porin n=1 Tax=Polaribacter huanghezhanensis TaxID=1354726 RepID=UPI0026478FF6|nr:porin [Polaribacter huanghezhanensis]WKD85668.1 Porin O [Polaribacter huanghezhanensis]